MTTASAILDQLKDIVASSLGADSVSYNDYSILETSASSAAILSWNQVNSEPDTMGRSGRRRQWTMSIDIFVRDPGNPRAMLEGVTRVLDQVLPDLEQEDNWNGLVDIVDQVEATLILENLLQAGGAVWAPIAIRLTAVELL